MAKKKEPEININMCTLPELATELQKRFKTMDDNRYYVDCGCDDYCCCDGHYAVYMNDFRSVEEVIQEFAKRMGRVV